MCHSSLIAQALVDGGLVERKPQVVDSSDNESDGRVKLEAAADDEVLTVPENDEKRQPEEKEDDVAVVLEQPKAKTKHMKKMALTLAIDDDGNDVSAVTAHEPK